MKESKPTNTFKDNLRKAGGTFCPQSLVLSAQPLHLYTNPPQNRQQPQSVYSS